MRVLGGRPARTSRTTPGSIPSSRTCNTDVRLKTNPGIDRVSCDFGRDFPALPSSSSPSSPKASPHAAVADVSAQRGTPCAVPALQSAPSVAITAPLPGVETSTEGKSAPERRSIRHQQQSRSTDSVVRVRGIAHGDLWHHRRLLHGLMGSLGHQCVPLSRLRAPWASPLRHLGTIALLPRPDPLQGADLLRGVLPRVMVLPFCVRIVQYVARVVHPWTRKFQPRPRRKKGHLFEVRPLLSTRLGQRNQRCC